MNDLFSLKGRKALITGGSRGIGRMIAAGSGMQVPWPESSRAVASQACALREEM